jgi:NADPH-dependent glutamate synthase beta subunit-like oxidoreductase
MTHQRPDQPKELTVLQASMIRPLQQAQAPPCGACASGTDVRGWIALIAQRHKLGLSDHEAYARAWESVAAINPFPAIMGRICPHPCQTDCSRAGKDGAVAINALERFLGDWGLARALPLPRLAEPGSRPESIGVIGAGPAGLSFAYQMARRGYRVTVYESASKPGGALYFGIPEYRLPEQVLEAEIARIVDLGVDLRLDTAVGRDLDLATLRNRHEVLFLGIGAGRGLTLGIPGEDGPGAWTGTEYLACLNRGEPIALGERVVVVGGGNTAIDAARAARRSGAEVTLLYRRTRAEMPAIEAEVEDALAEGVQIEYLAAPVEILRENGQLCGVVVRRMELGEPDRSGRRAPVPIPGSDYPLPADAVIAAVSQQPDWEGLKRPGQETVWAEPAADGELQDGVWTGGDTRGLGIAGQAIAQGRTAAEAVCARLQGDPAPRRPAAALPKPAVKPDFYPARPPVTVPRKPVDQWRTEPDAELQGTITEAEFLGEISRCFSCGLCYGCEQCFMYCNASGITRLTHVAPGAYFAVSLERCQACGKCTDLCPCGFLTPQ